MKTIRTTLVSAFFSQFGICLGHFDITGQTQYTHSVCKYNIYLHSLTEDYFSSSVNITFICTHCQRITFLPL
jgi:hypothetical protein